MRKILEYLIIITGAMYLADIEPVWSFLAVWFVLYDLTYFILGEIEFRKMLKRTKSTEIAVPKNTSPEERSKIIREGIEKMLRSEDE